VLAQRVCAHAGVARIGLIRADIEQLPVRDGSMDFIHENGVIEHVADPTKMLSEALRVRAPRGTLSASRPIAIRLSRPIAIRLRSSHISACPSSAWYPSASGAS
jgi:ubiquinone/menaquinone biosynthesis C-methylase UbiE